MTFNPYAIYRLARGCYLALLALLLLWLLWLSPPAPPLLPGALLVLIGPLLLPLRGLMKGRRYTLAWSGMLILLYFMHGVAGMADPGITRILGAVEIALSMSYFGLAMYYLRLTSNRNRTTGTAKPKEPAVSPPESRE